MAVPSCNDRAFIIYILLAGASTRMHFAEGDLSWEADGVAQSPTMPYHNTVPSDSVGSQECWQLKLHDRTAMTNPMLLSRGSGKMADTALLHPCQTELRARPSVQLFCSVSICKHLPRVNTVL